MTEEGWLACVDSGRLLDGLPGRASRRKLRLFVCGVCRRNGSNIGKELFREALDVSEKFADGIVNDAALERASRDTALQSFRKVNMVQGHAHTLIHWATQPDDSMLTAAQVALSNKPSAQLWQSRAIRDIFGNPFRPVNFDPEWRTSTVVSIARTMYENRDFSMMPILSDALQDAGCSHEDILNHCRGDGPHVRGCWVVDMILGKE